ncbi:MAG TPA: hypothetical protein VFA56_00690 [Gaiellaceae bacterium]|nr:hypothetical protein [Gaiellaceae bacterium]
MTHLSEVEERFSQQDARIDLVDERLMLLTTRVEELALGVATQEAMLAEFGEAVVRIEARLLLAMPPGGSPPTSGGGVVIGGLVYGESFDNPDADQVRRNVDNVAIETGYSIDAGDRPDTVAPPPTLPTHGAPGEGLTISNLRVRSVQLVTVDGKPDRNFRFASGTLDFWVPSNVTPDAVVEVAVTADNIGTFTFPLQIDGSANRVQVS